MTRDESSSELLIKVVNAVKPVQRKPYSAPELTKYGHISKLTTGTSGAKKDGGTRRQCL